MFKIIFAILTTLHISHAFPSDMPAIIQKSSVEMTSSSEPITSSPSIMSTDIENGTISTKVSEMGTNPASNSIESFDTTMSEAVSIEKMPSTTIDTKLGEINSTIMDIMIPSNTMSNSEGTGMMTNDMSTNMKVSTADMTNPMTQSTSNSMESSLQTADAALNTITTKTMMTASPDVDVMDSTNNLKREQLNEAETTTMIESTGENKESSVTTEKVMEKSQETTQTEPQRESVIAEKTEESTMKPAMLLESTMPAEPALKPVTSEETTMKSAMIEETTMKTTMLMETTTMTEMKSSTEKHQQPGTPKPLTATMNPTETTTKMKNGGNMNNFSGLIMFGISSVLIMLVP